MTTFAFLTGAVIVCLLMIAVDFVFATVLYRLVDRVLPDNWYAYAGVRTVCGLASPIVAFVLMAVGVAAIVPPREPRGDVLPAERRLHRDRNRLG